uniref:Reverse transcriptase n=1 Tax=Cannabis sativa TaxID=3483 RepID=A0A803QD90_CANSA
MGDFNDYLSLTDKIGGDMSRAPSPQFQSFVDTYALHPLSLLGNLFTWTNRQKQPSHTQERLDWPLILTLHHLNDQRNHPPRFIFDKLSMSEPGFEDCLRDAWMQTNSNDHSNPLIGLHERLSNCASRLEQWKHSLGPLLATQIRDVHAQLKIVNSLPQPTNDQLNQGRQLENELNELLQKEEIYWQQRSRVTWLQHGDKNTRYFYRMASMRRNTNKILSLQRSDGSWANDTPSILTTIEQYFTHLFQSQSPDNEVIESVLSGISERLTIAEIELTQATFSATEIETATFQLAHDKAPGLDGFSGNFFQKNLHLLGPEIISAALSFLNGDVDLSAINQTLIVLIPKRPNPEQITEYRPIDLCSTFTKSSLGLVNFNKLALYFSPNTAPELQHAIASLLGIPVRETMEKYLGLPQTFGRSKKDAFNYINDRVWSHLNKWNSKFFSKGGKEVLLKSVVQAIPSYAMACFKLPASFHSKIESLMARFWWGGTEHNRKIHWKTWSFLCYSKFHGGLGFCSMKAFNQAMLAKQAWRLLQYPHSLVAILLKARYFPHTSFLHSGKGHRPSLVWSSINWGKELLQSGLRKSIGDGTTINIFNDAWIPGYGKLQFLRFYSNGNWTVVTLSPLPKNGIMPLSNPFSHGHPTSYSGHPLHSIPTGMLTFGPLPSWFLYGQLEATICAHSQLHHNEPTPRIQIFNYMVETSLDPSSSK